MCVCLAGEQQRAGLGNAEVWWRGLVWRSCWLSLPCSPWKDSCWSAQGCVKVKRSLCPHPHPQDPFLFSQGEDQEWRCWGEAPNYVLGMRPPPFRRDKQRCTMAQHGGQRASQGCKYHIITLSMAPVTKSRLHFCMCVSEPIFQPSPRQKYETGVRTGLGDDAWPSSSPWEGGRGELRACPVGCPELSGCSGLLRVPKSPVSMQFL